MGDAVPATGQGGIVYVDDDDDEMVDELLRLEGDSQTAFETASKVKTQIQLCITLLCMLPILGLLILLAWRRHGPRISAVQRAQATSEKRDS